MSGVLQARARFDGPDQHSLTVAYENDPEWVFEVRDQRLDGTLVPVHYGDVEMVLRSNPRASIDDSTSISGFFVGDSNLVTVALNYSDLPVDNTHFQLDVIRDGRRRTFAAGTIHKTGILGTNTSTSTSTGFTP